MRFLLVLFLVSAVFAQDAWYNRLGNWANQNIVAPTASAASSAADWTNRNVVAPTVSAAQTVHRNVVAPAADWTHRNVVAPTVNAAAHVHRNYVQPAAAAVARTGFRAVNTVAAGGAAVGRGLDWTFDRAWDGIKWADRKTGVSTGISNAARWANDKTGFTNGVSNLWQRSGAAGHWNRLTASTPGQQGALSKAWDWTKNTVSRGYNGAREGYARAGQSVGLSRGEMLRGFDNGVKTVGTAVQFVPVGRVAGVAFRAGRPAVTKIAAEKAVAESAAIAWGRAGVRNMIQTQGRREVLNEVRGPQQQQQQQQQQQRPSQQQAANNWYRNRTSQASANRNPTTPANANRSRSRTTPNANANRSRSRTTPNANANRSRSRTTPTNGYRSTPSQPNRRGGR